MKTLVLLALAGLGAQLVDGSLGMASAVVSAARCSSAVCWLISAGSVPRPVRITRSAAAST